ncbi:metallophosphoesterase family protein [Erythrobacter alti]|uniref:metallophosphoesterase family protein n=1 Tax=Erythrobacter alti TaxID=1896145 RepID=UPI0030F40FFF
MKALLARLTLGLATLGLAACAATDALGPTSATQQSNAPLRIAVIGDRTGGHRPHVFERAMEHIEQLQPDLVLSVGDLVEGYVEDEDELARQWDEIEALIAPFGSRFLSVPGNHDYANATMARIWTERRGTPYWSEVRDGVLILGLSTEDPPVPLPESAVEGHLRLQAAIASDPEGTQARILEAYRDRENVEKPGEVAISDAQVEHFRQVLGANPAPRWTIVLMHKPAWIYDSANFERIEAMLGDRPYTMIAGHEHYYAHEERFGRDYITTGTTGGIWLQDGPGRVDHLLWVALGEGEPTFTNIGIDGMFGVTGR